MYTCACVEEIFFSARGLNKDVYLLSTRKGFIRLALKNGCNLYPALAFGNNELYDFRNFHPELNRKLCKRLRMVVPGLIGVFGRWGSLIPYKEPVTVVLGPPLMLPCIPFPSEEQVDHVHASYVEHVRAVFMATREMAGFPDRALEII
eukprot:g59610.t1